MTEQLRQYITSLDPSALAESRKDILNQLVQYIRTSDHPKLNFICTHNSRRSQLGQVWAQTFAYFFGIKIETYSGGTEATAFHPNAVAALRRAGFFIEEEDKDENPYYRIRYADQADPMECFSKVYDHPNNPVAGFAAIMTCSEADAECPLVLGADVRIKLFYEDPKISDGTVDEVKTYDQRCKQIATEMYFVFSQIKR